MSMGKERIEKQLSRVERRFERVLEQKRLEWLQRVCREAQENYGFKSLGELVVYMVDHGSDIKLKEGA
jgi:uncharacterized damage-inducible protein DinB